MKEIFSVAFIFPVTFNILKSGYSAYQFSGGCRSETTITDLSSFDCPHYACTESGSDGYQIQGQ
jgi:hypothetical protein